MLTDKHYEAIISFNAGSRAFEYVTMGKSGFIKRYRVFSRHNRDIGTLIIIYCVIFAIVAVTAFVLGGISYEPAGENKKLVFHLNSSSISLIFGAAIFGGLVNIISKLIENAQKRLGTIDLFVSEILSIGRIFTSGNLVGGFVYLNYELKSALESDGAKPAVHGTPVRFSSELRKENYLSIFEKNNVDLGPLSAKVVSNVTAFYTFLKASRDSTGKMALWNNVDYLIHERFSDIISVIYYCLLLSIHGRQALSSMIENEEEKDYAIRVFETIEIQSFLFLCGAVQDLDMRRNPLAQRFPHYKELILTKYRESAGSDIENLISAIEARFGSPQSKCVIHNNNAVPSRNYSSYIYGCN